MHISHRQTAVSPYQALHSAAAPRTASSAVAPQDTSDDSDSSSDTSEATITANDFLTLLVSEMKNQDPTSDTDPNEYINQLVQVNSLEQLIQINTDLGGDSSGSSSDDSVSARGGAQASHAVKGNLGESDSGLDGGSVASALGRPSGPQAAGGLAAQAESSSTEGTGRIPEALAAASSAFGNSPEAFAPGPAKQGSPGRRALPLHLMQR